MVEINKDQKAKLKALENDIKVAFKEGRFEVVKDIAKDIKTIDSDNHLAVRLLEKLEKAALDAKAKENAAKIKEYQTMIGKMLKDGNLENVRKLSQELKELDPKSAEMWVKKAEDAEVQVKQKQNAGKIKELEKQLNIAFKENRFEEVAKLAEKVKELDSKNKTVAKLLGNIEKAKADVKRKENAGRINALQDQIKLAFKEARFEEMGKTANKLFEIDPDNTFAKKHLAKAVKVKEAAQKAKIKAEAKAKVEADKKIKMEVKAKVEVKKPEEKKVEKKGEGFFAKMFKKKDKKLETKKVEIKKAEAPVAKAVTPEAKPVEPAKVAPMQPVATKPQVMPAPAAKAQPIQPTVEKPEPAKVEDVKPSIAPASHQKLTVKTETKPTEATEEIKPEDLEGDKGNIFTKMFGQKEELEKPQGSIIDTIVAKSSEKKAEAKGVQKPKKEKEPGLALVGFTRAFLQFSVAFIIISAGFFYVQNIDVNNTVLGIFGVEDNYASQLHGVTATLTEKQESERNITKEINRYKEGYNNEYEETVGNIVKQRMNWPDIMTKISEIANAVYERNEISQYIKFNNFTFDAKTGQVRVSGSLSDPLGKNLTKLVELEEMFSYFPKDKNNPDDPTKPYFYDIQEFKSLSKTYNTNSGKYTSTFQISFSLQESKEE